MGECVPFPIRLKDSRRDGEKREAEAPAFAAFASDARRDLEILPAAYLEGPKAHQEKNKRAGKKRCV